MIVYMLPYIQNQHYQIVRTLKYKPVPDIMVERLKKRLKHCKVIMEHYARLDPNTYCFSLTDDSHNFGNPLQDFLTYWNGIASHLPAPATNIWFADNSKQK